MLVGTFNKWHITGVSTSTQSYGRIPAAGLAFFPRAQLFVAMNCAALDDPPSRHSIEGAFEVRLGRGALRQAKRTLVEGRKRVELAIADTHVSSEHARLSCERDIWTVEDLRSKNGVFVNGDRVQRAILRDGDRITLGQTILIFRSGLPTPVDAPLDVTETAQVPGLATLLPQLARELDALRAVATGDLPILLISETGTGKELLARAVHNLSRRTGELVAVNCGGLPPTLVESTLFGHQRGAFSGATTDQPGLFRSAKGGTLFLDEVGEMPLDAQRTILRALQEGEVLPVGATRSVRIDARVIAATNKDLEARIVDGSFREDLYGRLAGFSFRLPPLRERREDLGLIARAILADASNGQSLPSIRPEAASYLFAYSWPRNIRELHKCLVLAMTLAAGASIEPEHLPAHVRAKESGPIAPASNDVDQRARLILLLEQHRGNLAAVAQALHTSRSQVHRSIARYGIDLAAYRRS